MDRSLPGPDGGQWQTERRLRHECEQLKLALAEATVQLRIWQKGSEFVVASQERCKRLGCRLHGDVRRRL
jgi:transposase